MADTKISALTAATTPLAGTEVLPIVQSGVTKKVAVADLTAGRAVSALSMTLTNALAVTSGGTGLSSFTANGVMYASSTSALATSSGFTYDGTNVMVNAAPSRDNFNVQYKQLFYNTAGDGSANTVIGQIRSQVRNYGTNIATASFASIQFATDPTTWYKGEIRFLTNGTDGTDGVGTVNLTLKSNGDLQINNGRTYSKIGSNTITNGSTQTLFTLGTGDVYIVNCSYANFFGATTTAIVWLPQAGNTSYSGIGKLGETTANFTLSVSGANVQITNNAGASVTYYWSAIKLY